MTVLQYCILHEPTAKHHTLPLQVHGIDYGIDDHIFLTDLRGEKPRFLRLKIYYNVSDARPFIKYTSEGKSCKRVYLDDFVRIDSPFCGSVVFCDELKKYVNKGGSL